MTTVQELERPLRSSASVQADIDGLEAKLAAEMARLDALEASEGTDYQTLLTSGPADTSVIDKIAKASALIAVYQRALIAAREDLRKRRRTAWPTR